MTFDPNDPRLTAFVLDDPSLSETERAEVAELLAHDAEANKFAEELRAAANHFGDCLAKEPTPAVASAPSLEAAVRSEMDAGRKETVLSPVRYAAWRIAKLAAVAAVMLFGIGYLMLPWVQQTRRSAQLTFEMAATQIQNGGGGNPVPKAPEAIAVSPVVDAEREQLHFQTGDGRGATSSLGLNRLEDGLSTTVTSPAAGGAVRFAESGQTGNPTAHLSAMAPADAAGTVPVKPAIVANNPTPSRGLASEVGRGPVKQDGPDRFRVLANIQVDAKSTRTFGERVSVDEKIVPKIADPAGQPIDEGWIAEREARAKLGFNTEAYPVLTENDFLAVNRQNALSTFSIDVDTASYANVRRFLTQNALPPPGAVRIEEMVNYFPYAYPPPVGDVPFAVHLETAECPWNPQHRLARIALKGKEIDVSKRPPSNLVFLLDVSGSMNEPNKLPLVKASLKLLVEQLGENDRVAIAVYAGSSGLVLDGTRGDKKAEILYAIDNLQPSGSTNGAAGIKVAYEAAVKSFIVGGANRVILCTDGDFNVGVSSDDELVSLITEKAKTGVFLSVLGFGMGNYKDAKMMQLADKGNGNYAYIDSLKEGKKVLVEQMSGTLVTIAKDVKIQVEFNPAKVAAYRLVGYEKRMLKAEDFKDDKKDAGEIGAGHTVTALYELVPAGMTTPAGKVDDLVFQKTAKAPETSKQDPDLAKQSFLLKLRYKQPEGATSTEIRFPGVDDGKKYTLATADFQFAAAVASFGQLLRDSKFKGNANFASVLELAESAKGKDPGGYRTEFVNLVKKAKELKK